MGLKEARLAVVSPEEEATVKRYHYDVHHQLKRISKHSLTDTTYLKRLKTLKGLTPYEHICKCWTKDPNRLALSPLHEMVGLNT